MSGEFGGYRGGYLDIQIGYAALDCSGGWNKITRLYGELFEALREPVRGVCYAEAADSSEESACRDFLAALPAIRKALDDIEAYAKDRERTT